jgi:hypothetical protein
VPALLFCDVGFGGSTILLGWKEKANPRVLDLHLFSFDSSLTLGWIGALRFVLKSFWISSVFAWTCCILKGRFGYFRAKKAEAATDRRKIRGAVPPSAVRVAVF